MDKLNLILKKLVWKREWRPFGWGTSPDADWKIILISTFLLIVLMSVWSFFKFIRINDGAVFDLGNESEEVEPLFNLDNLQETVSYYKSKNLEFEKIGKDSSSSVVDPSI